MKLDKILDIDCIRTIHLIYSNGGELRFSEIAKTFASRSSLSACLRDLEENKVIRRRVEVDEKPVKVYYSLTERGRRLGFHISKLYRLIREGK